MPSPMNVGVVGLGAIGRAVCRALDEGIPGLRLSGATARDREKAERFLKGPRSPAPLPLAGIGPEKTRIKLYAVPGLTMNRHRITVVGEFGRLAIEVENVPSENPRTGKLSYMSTIALLRELTASLRVGT